MFEPASVMLGARSRSVAFFRVMQTTLLIGNLAFTTLALGGFPAETKLPTGILTALLIVVTLLERVLGTERVFDRTGWLFVPFLIYAAINVAVVTPVPWLGWWDWLSWAQLIGVFWVTLHLARRPGARRAVMTTFVLLAVTQVGLAAYQHFGVADWLMLGRKQAPQFLSRSSGSFGAPNSLGAFLLLVLPLVAGLALQRTASAVGRVWWGYVTLSLVFALALTQSRGAWFAIAIVTVGAPALILRGPATKRFASVVVCGLALTGVAWAILAVFPSGRERLVQLRLQSGELSRPIMWRAARAMFRSQPLTGTGGGSFAVEFDQYRPENFQLEPRWAHNELLNTLSEYGLIGLALGLGAVAVALSRRNPKQVVETNEIDERIHFAMGAGLIAFSLQLLVDFSLKIPALALSFAVLAGMWVGARRTDAESAEWAPDILNRVGAALSAIGLILGTIFWMGPSYRAEAMRVAARSMIDKIAAERRPALENEVKSAQEVLGVATSLAPTNAKAWSDFAYVTTLLEQFEPARGAELGRIAERSAERALQISDRVAEFWMQLAVARDLQGKWTDAGSALVEGLKRAPTRAGVWYQQAAHLERNPRELDRALAAVDLSLRLDPGNPEAHALRRRLAERVGAP